MRKLVSILALLLLLASAARAQSITVGSLTLTPCRHQYNGYCGSLSRPIDPTGQVPGQINIGFEFYPHTDNTTPPQGAIAAQEGGPGYSTTGSRDGYVRLFTPLRTHRDIVLIDKRGTGRSAAIDCKRLQRSPYPYLEAIRACGAQLGRRAWLYGSDLAADDMACVLQALQTGPVDYYGDSYATFFGQVFATRHPDMVRTIVLDSAYPVLANNGSPYFPTEVENGPVALAKVCARSQACVSLAGSVGDRFATLLASLRLHPVSGAAPGANGQTRMVTANPASLFLVFYEVGNNLIAYRDLDAAGRAYLGQSDALPLLRLVAEAEDSSGGGGPANQFSNGLATAVICGDYHTLYDMRAPESDRQPQFLRAIKSTQTHNPAIYAPFLLSDALAAPTDPVALDSCLAWPTAPLNSTPGIPVPHGTAFPKVPVLVLAGELDTVTSPKEAAQTTALFPQAWFVVVRNTGHETAVGDGGAFVPPNGADLAGCSGQIVLHFVASGGNPGDTSCAVRVRPVRTVPDFARNWAAVAPAEPAAGNMADPDGLTLASAATETVGDAVARYFVTTSGTVQGLRGGRFHLTATPRGYDLHLDHLRWTQDLAVSGTIAWNQLDGHIQADITLAAPGHTGTLTLDWDDRATSALARIAGQIDGQVIAATRLAP